MIDENIAQNSLTARQRQKKTDSDTPTDKYLGRKHTNEQRDVLTSTPTHCGHTHRNS